MKMMLAALGLLALLTASAPAQAAQTNGTYVDGSGAHLASVSVCCTCTGSVTITIITDESPARTISAQAESVMVPDLCGIGCLDCPWPFTWTLVGSGVDLSGGGVATTTWSMQGTFQGGVLEFHGPPAVSIGDFASGA